MSLASRLQKTAARLVTKYGADMIVTARAQTPDREDGKPWRGSTGTTKVTVRAVQYAYEAEEAPDASWRNSHSRFIVSENNTDGNPQFTEVDLTTAVDLEDTAGNVWSIDGVEIVEPSDERVAYILYGER